MLLIFVAPTIISQIIRAPLGHWTIGGEDAWIGFLGNYSGGVLGGIVAFLVASDQIKKQREQEKVQILANELPVLEGLQLELEKILNQLLPIETNDKELWEKENKESYKISLDALIWRRWEGIHKINDPVLQGQLIRHQEALERNIEVFGIDIGVLEDALEEKKAIERKMSPLDSNFIKLRREISKENMYLGLIKKDKIHYLQEMKYCIEKTQRILNNVSQRKVSIHRILVEGNFYSDELLSNPEDYKIER